MFKNFTAYSMLFLAITIVPEVIPFEAWAEEKKSGGGWFGNIDRAVVGKWLGGG